MRTLILILALSGCAGTGSIIKQLEQCAPAPADLLMLTGEVLLQGSPDWAEQLAKLGGRVGVDLVQCAVAELAATWLHQPLRWKGPGRDYPAARARALEYLSSQP